MTSRHTKKKAKRASRRHNKDPATTATTTRSDELKNDFWLPTIKRRHRYTDKEIKLLEKQFNKDPKPSEITKQKIANRLSVDKKIITIWFRNKRSKIKKSQEANSSQSVSSSSFETVSSVDDSSEQEEEEEEEEEEEIQQEMSEEVHHPTEYDAYVAKHRNGLVSSPITKPRLLSDLSNKEKELLEEEFVRDSNPSEGMIQDLANVLSIDVKIINTWFQNKRAKINKKEVVYQVKKLRAVRLKQH